MSGGKIYGPVTDGSVDPLTRITELERLWPIMQQKLAAYDGLIADVQAIRQDLAKLKSSHQESAQDISMVSSQAQDTTSYLNSRLGIIEKSIADKFGTVASAFKDHASAISSVSADVQQVKTLADSVKETLLSKISTLASRDELQAHKDQSSSLQAASSSLISGLGSKFADVKAKIEEFASSLGIHKDSLSNVSEDLHTVNGFAQDLRSEINAVKAQLPRVVLDATAKVSAEVDAKLKDLKSAVSPAAALGALRDEFEKKIEGVALDGTNAVLRSTNATAQIAMLEKKIENILLRLKAIEIPK